MRPYISKRGTKYRARAVITDTDGQDRWITLVSGCDSAEDAEEQGWAALSKIKKGVWIDPRDGETTLERWANTWLPAQELQLSSYQQYVYLLSNFVLPEYGDRALTSLTYADHEIAAWEQRIRSAYSASTATQARGLLKRMLEDAASQKLIERNPAERRGRRGSVEERRLQDKNTRKAEDEKWTNPLGALLLAERLSLLSGRDDEFILAITKAYTAMRMGELIGLERDRITATTIDVRWQLYELNDSSTIRKNPKDGSLRTIDVPPHVVRLLYHQIRKLGPYDPVHAPLCPCIKHDGDAEFRQKYGHPRGAHVFRGTTSVRSRLGAAGVRLADVAGAAGVSTGTVSNVLNRPEKVSETVRHTVEAALEDFGLARETADSGGYARHTIAATGSAPGCSPRRPPGGIRRRNHPRRARCRSCPTD
ncbi:integrase [Lipingzhangella halophila]|uniref:Integrase n=1 Tax=Lipingzhangella halophila TaxID=1783352 RepID=A0A7W7RGC6_9ACTN|nr:LacI family DNA-binding transcriptional regulator [Lipingzhangella halophila]MBB4931385.1 integrase [Lipingzhangella halophila]